MKKGRVFSGARPTGRQHLGNYLGAIRNYVALQEDYDCVYCVVDLHALTTLEGTEHLREHTYEMVLDWLAAGMDPERSIIFVQSHVPQVTELHTLLSMATPLGVLLRLPTFKDKVRQQPDNVNYGLVGYPVLMAADIVLYKADAVPVGVDQAPHLEFTRDIVRRFNKFFSPDPERIVQIEADCRSAGIGCVEHKREFARHLAEYLAPFRARRAELAADPEHVWDVLADGADRARQIAAQTIAEVKESMRLP